MNKVFLIGNLTKDPELSSTASGIKFCRFTLAVSRSYSKDGKRETDFLPVVVWRAQADKCARYLKKGSRAAKHPDEKLRRTGRLAPLCDGDCGRRGTIPHDEERR